MNGYLDIHSHILPGVDDGSQSMDMSMQMIRQAYDEGVRYMVATPHYYPGHKNADREHILEMFSQVKEESARQVPNMTLMLGNEIYYKDEVPTLLQEKKIFTLGETRYVLVEFNVAWEYAKIHQAIKRLTLKGFYPIVAHVERYDSLYKRPERVRELIQTGAYIQVNANTFLGGMFDGYKKYCMNLMQEGMVHFIGSDAHNTDGRKTVMGQAIKVLRKKTDTDILDRVLISNPQRYMNNEYI